MQSIISRKFFLSQGLDHQLRTVRCPFLSASQETAQTHAIPSLYPSSTKDSKRSRSHGPCSGASSCRIHRQHPRRRACSCIFHGHYARCFLACLFRYICYCYDSFVRDARYLGDSPFHGFFPELEASRTGDLCCLGTRLDREFLHGDPACLCLSVYSKRLGCFPFSSYRGDCAEFINVCSIDRLPSFIKKI